MVQCYSCGAKRYWKEGDDPFDEHFHENCRHLKYITEKQVCNQHCIIRDIIISKDKKF